MSISRKLILSLMLISLSGCYVPQSGYYPDYDEDYIYSVSYYGYRPYDWGEGYYWMYGYGTRNFVNQPRAYETQPKVLERKIYHPRTHVNRRG